MKKQFAYIAIATLIGLACFTRFPAKADRPDQQPRAAVIIVASEHYTDGRAAGLYVLNVSASTYAPAIQTGQPVAEAIAILLAAGFHLETPYANVFTLVK